jgi:ATP-binding cassette subfamily B protein
MAATAVIHGQMTLGMMLAVSYILGQLNSPLNQLIVFMQLAQDAKISLERINDIEETATENELAGEATIEMPVLGGIAIKNLSFQYEGPHSPSVLDDVSLEIPDKKVTAIVGVSGSGKTTLVKLLLGFYSPVKGEIRVGDMLLNRIHPKVWRNKCGAVMQDGYIFSDSMARNIAMGEEDINMKKMLEVAQIAQLDEFVDSLPMGYNTKIGANGQGLSQGQKQRILIARALYKDPSFLFFDEATNSLDAKNEKLILTNLEQYFSGRTVVVVAHRLSTVKDAHQIVVLEKGKICETGTHDELIQKKGIYFRLIKDQLELGM